MAIRIYCEDITIEKDIFLRLFPSGDGVKLAACNSDGEILPASNLLTVSSDGIKLHEYVSDKLGIRLDKTKTIHIIGD